MRGDAGAINSTVKDARINLAAKYAGAGPRYTSYPTAPQFSTDFPLEEYLTGLAVTSASQSAPLSLYIHVPFCRDICYYCGCNKIVTRKPGVAKIYLEHLQTEIVKQAELVGRSRPVVQMHWGGGTPTYLDNAEIIQLMQLLASNFELLSDDSREYSIEIDPRTVDPASIALLKTAGFNRISLGIQDFDPRVQQATNRIQPYQLVLSLVAAIRRHEFRSLSFDLIYGLPYQDSTTMSRTLDQVIGLRPDRVACYNYAHLPERFSSQRAIDRLTLPSVLQKLELQQQIADSMRDAGYLHIGMDHFVLPEDPLALAQAEGRLQRNFQGYSLHMADDILGLGVSAISQMGQYYLQNERDLQNYYNHVNTDGIAITRGCRLNEDDRLRRHVIMRLISDLVLDTDACSLLFGISFERVFTAELEKLRSMECDGLVRIKPGEIRVTDRGRPFLRNICMPFDAYLNQPVKEQAGKDQTSIRFSATI